MDGRTARLRTLVNSPTWTDLNAMIQESLLGLLRNAMNAETEEEAISLLREARGAQKFASSFSTSVDATAQGE